MPNFNKQELLIKQKKEKKEKNSIKMEELKGENSFILKELNDLIEQLGRDRNLSIYNFLELKVKDVSQYEIDKFLNRTNIFSFIWKKEVNWYGDYYLDGQQNAYPDNMIIKDIFSKEELKGLLRIY